MSDGLPWQQLFDLHVVKKTAQIMAKRWHMGLGYLDLADNAVCPPSPTRHTANPQSLCQVIQDTAQGAGACCEQARATAERVRDVALTQQAQQPRQPRQPRPSQARQSKPRVFTITCHAGLSELVAPILLGGEHVGALLCGPFAGALDKRDTVLATLDRRAQELALSASDYHKSQRRLSWFDDRELSFASTLLEAAAEEIAVFLAGTRTTKTPREPTADKEPTGYHGIIGRSAPMHELYSVLDRVVRSDATVLIQGENGTGKELVARAIHYGSDRAERRFVVTNCSAFNDNLLDSELFGHKKGAFTGAFADKQGLFEAADTGTFFLDEIGDMSPSLQVKVLRVLQEGTFTPVGDTEMRRVDVRIIAATNRNLEAMVADGTFREDLYYRINVINLRIPPLRERRDDIEVLAEYFLKKHGPKNDRPPKTLSRGCLRQFMQYDWPGNVRELENEIERLLVLSGDVAEIDESLLSSRIRAHVPRVEITTSLAGAMGYSLPNALRDLEQRMLLDALERHGWNKTRAAAELEISRRNLIRLVHKYELEAHRPKSG